MKEILQSLLDQVDDLDSLQAVRTSIIELIALQLEQSRHPLDQWGKAHLAHAIDALALNVEAVQQPTNAWLRLCLTDLGKAFIPPETRQGPCPDHVIDVENLSHEKMKQRLESVAQKFRNQPISTLVDNKKKHHGMEIEEPVWVGLVGGIILARMQGPSTPALLKECHGRLVAVVEKTGCKKVLYHLLDVELSPTGLMSTQQALNQEIQDVALKRAVLVQDPLLAFRTSMAFGLSSRVFGDMAKAVEWLEQD